MSEKSTNNELNDELNDELIRCGYGCWICGKVCADCTVCIYYGENMGKKGCRKCFEQYMKNIDMYSYSLWYDEPSENRMQEITINYKYRTNQIDYDDLEWQNQCALELARNADWDGLKQNLERNLERRKSCNFPWEGMSKYTLIEVCEHIKCPETIVEMLLESKINYYTTRPCLNPCGIGSMKPINVAAEKGNVNALRVFIQKQLYQSERRHATLNAFYANQAEAFEFLCDSYAGEREDLSRTLRSEFDVFYMHSHAAKEGLYDVLTILKRLTPIKN